MSPRRPVRDDADDCPDCGRSESRCGCSDDLDDVIGNDLDTVDFGDEDDDELEELDFSPDRRRP